MKFFTNRDKKVLKMEQYLNEELFSGEFLHINKVNSLINNPKWTLEELEIISDYVSEKIQKMDKIIKHGIKKRTNKANGTFLHN